MVRTPEYTQADAHPRVSFLIGTHVFNPAFEKAVHSCRAQRFISFEIVVVANGMDDDVFAALRAFCMAHGAVVLRTDIRYLTFSLNLGVHACRGEYIARMDSDDLCFPQRLERQVQFMDRHTDIAVCGSDCALLDPSDAVIGYWHYPRVDRSIRWMLYFKNPFCHPSVLIRRRVLTAVGGYSGLHAEDYVLWVALSRQTNLRFANMPEPLIGYRADQPTHPRMDRWRKSALTVFSVQVHCYFETFNPMWLLGSVYTLSKYVFVMVFKGGRR